MKQYVCVTDGKTEILSEEQITEKVKAGQFYQQYYEIGKEMELVIKLIPKPKVVKPKKAVTRKDPNQ